MAQSGKKSSAKSGGAGKAKAGKPISASKKAAGDKTAVIIGTIAVVVIVGIIAVGLVINANKTAIQNSGYGVAASSTAGLSDKGTIAVSNGDAPLTLDIYEDAICPACSQFETQYGEQIAEAIDNGELTVRFHMVDFLNGASFSGDYSSRAYAALAAVAKHDGGEPGTFMKFHAAIFAPENQPRENSTADLTNAELAQLAASVGASEAAQDDIAAGSLVGDMKMNASQNMMDLRDAAEKAGTTAGTPAVVKDGLRLELTSVDWLAELLDEAASGADATDSE